jgi:hypothetical protein
MIITKKAIPRRTMLRGVGACVALPLLDAMVPALSALARTATPKRRLGVVYVPMGIVMRHWTPTAEGTSFELPQILQPLASLRERLVLLSGLANTQAKSLDGEPAGGHGRIGGAFLTGVHVKPTEGADFRAGISMDQIAAKELGLHTELASLELGIETTDVSGACDVGFSCAYTNTMSWQGPTTPLPIENNPRSAFERLFGDSGTIDQRAQLARLQANRSILDAVAPRAGELRGQLGSGDRVKLTEYLDAIRDIERRVQRAEELGNRDLPRFDQPAGIPATYEEHVKLMFDLQVLAYQADITRVITFMMSRELSSRTYPELGITEQHHPLSHHTGDSQKIAKLVKLQSFHAGLLAYYLEKLRVTSDGDGSILDSLTLVYGSGMSDSDMHNHLDLPILVAGGGAGTVKGGRHLRYPEGTPIANLYLSLLGKLGAPIERFGDSTGEVQHLTSI